MKAIQKRCSNKECGKRFRTKDKRTKYCPTCKPTSKAKSMEAKRKTKPTSKRTCCRCNKKLSLDNFQGKERTCTTCKIENNPIVLAIHYMTKRTGTTYSLPEFEDVIDYVSLVSKARRFCYSFRLENAKARELGLFSDNQIQKQDNDLKEWESLPIQEQAKRIGDSKGYSLPYFYLYMPGALEICHVVSHKAGGTYQRDNLHLWPRSLNRGYKEDHSQVYRRLSKTLHEGTVLETHKEMTDRFPIAWEVLINKASIKGKVNKCWKTDVSKAIEEEFTDEPRAVELLIKKDFVKSEL